MTDAQRLAAVPPRVLAHYREHARPLPWRRARDPYAIWICEIMAQQTRIAAMLPYWERWMARFPTVATLAAAPLDDVLAMWAGLGYYARARSLHAAAKKIVTAHDGRVPDSVDALLALPGIGRYTAGAIASIAHDRPAPIVDGNVARILARVFGIEADVRSAPTQKLLWRLAGELVPPDAPGDFNQGLMDLGATICTPRAPTCDRCPLTELCVARTTGQQEDLPILPARRAPKIVVQRAVLITQGDKWLLARRAPHGLYGGLWELPDPAAVAGITVARDTLVVHTQQLTHRTIHHRVHAARLRKAGAPVIAAPYDTARFVSPARLGMIGVSSATKQIISLLHKETSWQTPPRRTRSSAKATRRSSRG
jgi:A/G-specific adenine glycosylase